MARVCDLGTRTRRLCQQTTARLRRQRTKHRGPGPATDGKGRAIRAGRSATHLRQPDCADAAGQPVVCLAGAHRGVRAPVRQHPLHSLAARRCVAQHRATAAGRKGISRAARHAGHQHPGPRTAWAGPALRGPEAVRAGRLATGIGPPAQPHRCRCIGRSGLRQHARRSPVRRVAADPAGRRTGSHQYPRAVESGALLARQW